MITTRFRHRARGMTLVEVSMAMFINLLGVFAVFSTLIISSKMAAQAHFTNKACMEARMVIDMLTSDARMAVTLESSYSTYTAGANTLILKLPAIKADGFPVDPETKFDRIVYHKAPSSTQKLMRTVLPDASSARKSESRVVGESVSPGIYTIQPDPIGQYVIYYSFKSVHKWGGKTAEFPVGGSVQLRNHHS